MSTQKRLMSQCTNCHGNKRHVVIAERTVRYDEEYHAANIYMIIQCLGCEIYSFREDFEDYEQGNANSDVDGGWEYPITTKCYPKGIAGHIELDRPFAIPHLVKNIYRQTLNAIKEDSGILSGLGLRGTIEAVCNNLNVTGTNLDRRINGLMQKGFISKRDADRLHGIRFLGNDAAHDIKDADSAQISVALKIVEHLLTSVYILDQEADGHLDTLISDYTEFCKLLRSEILEFKTGDIEPLAKLVGKSLRRVKDNLATLEAQLIIEINNGKFKELSIDAVQTAGNPPNNIQTFRVL